MRSKKLKTSGHKTVNRREFVRSSLYAGLALPAFIKTPLPILEPIFRKEEIPRPEIKTPDETWNEGFTAVFNELENNLQSKGALFRSVWAKPAPRMYATYQWQTCFMSLVWSLWRPRIALEIFQPFFSSQRSDGRIPGQIDMTQIGFDVNPPMMAWSLEKLVEASNDVSPVKTHFNALVKYHNWYYRERYGNKGMYVWKSADESIMDNSPRFLPESASDLPKNFARLIPIDLNCMIVMQLRSLSALAKRIGANAQAETYLRDANLLALRINKYLWSAADGLYYDLYENEHLKIPSIASFYPLSAGIVNEEQLQKLLKNLLDPNKFWTKMPFPSMAVKDPRFKLDKWQGPSWLSASYMVIKGLDNCGKRDIAAEAAKRIVNFVFKTWGDKEHFYEFYHPLGGSDKELKRSGNFLKNVIFSGEPIKDFVGETGLVNNLLIEYILGLSWKNGKPVFTPSLPKEWVDQPVRYKSPYLKLDATLKLDRAGKVKITIASPAAGEIETTNVVYSSGT